MNDTIGRSIAAAIVIAIAALLSGCNNGYAAPQSGAPATWGQRHYVDVQQQSQMQYQRRRRH
jgi:hypothetical protein